MEKNENVNKKLFEEIVDGIKNGSDMEYSIQTWIDEDLFQAFDVAIESKKDTIIDEKTKKKIMETLVEMCPEFFLDNSNIVYLKLLNLYEINKDKNGENHDLYYITTRFVPATDEFKKVTTTLETIKERVLGSEKYVDETFKNFLANEKIYEKAMNEYWLANNFGKNLCEEKDDELLEEASTILSKTVDIYTKETAFEIITDNRSSEFMYKIIDTKGLKLPKLFCNVYGGEFTNEEKIIVSNVLDQTEKELFSSTIGGKSK